MLTEINYLVPGHIESEQHFILKNDQILSITSIYNLLLKHVKMLVSYDT